jgi:hypothetical protein
LRLGAVSLFTLAGSLLVATAAHAQAKDQPRRLHLGFGVDVMAHVGDECVQSGDATGCEANKIFFPFVFTGSFRVLPWVSLGGRFSAASANTGTGVPRHISIWQLSFEPRIYPLGDTRLAPFIGLAFGYGSLRQTSAQVPEKTTHGSLLVGGSLGVDIGIAEWLAFTPELRVARMSLEPSQPERTDGRSTYYTGSVWFSVGMQLVALLPV